MGLLYYYSFKFLKLNFLEFRSFRFAQELQTIALNVMLSIAETIV